MKRGLPYWQSHGDTCVLPGSAVDLYVAIVLLHHIVGNRQTGAHLDTRITGGEAEVEDVLQLIGGNTTTIVDDRHSRQRPVE